MKHYLLSFAFDSLIASGNEWVANGHLADFCKQKLSQTGRYIIINGKFVLDDKGNKEKGRKKTTNKWFETQDSINYWEDFSRPKIVYPETTQGAFFAFDDSGLVLDKTCFMLISDYAVYLQRSLSSLLFEFAYKNIYSSVELGAHGYQYNKHALIKLPIILPDETIRTRLSTCSIDEIDEVIYLLYSINFEEQVAIKHND